MALKKTDYVEQKGVEKIQFKRGVRIDEKSTELTVELAFNHRKGIFLVTTKWNNDQIVGGVDDEATLKTLTDLMLVARKKGIQMREEWQAAKSKEDPDQMSMGFPNQEDDTQQ